MCHASKYRRSACDVNSKRPDCTILGQIGEKLQLSETERHGLGSLVERPMVSRGITHLARTLSRPTNHLRQRRSAPRFERRRRRRGFLPKRPLPSR